MSDEPIPMGSTETPGTGNPSPKVKSTPAERVAAKARAREEERLARLERQMARELRDQDDTAEIRAIRRDKQALAGEAEHPLQRGRLRHKQMLRDRTVIELNDGAERDEGLPCTYRNTPEGKVIESPNFLAGKYL